MEGSPQGPGPSEAGENPLLLTPEEQNAAMAEREAAEAARRQVVQQSLESGDPIPVEHAVVNPEDMSPAAKIQAMRRSGMTDAQIDDELAKGESAQS